MKESSGGFAEVMESANQMARAPIAHPFGAPLQGVAAARPRQGLPIRQTTEVFALPNKADEYDALMNRAWSGEIEIRYEERQWTKESDLMIVVCYFEHRIEPRPHDVAAEGDAEPEEKSRKLP